MMNNEPNYKVKAEIDRMQAVRDMHYHNHNIGNAIWCDLHLRELLGGRR